MILSQNLTVNYNLKERLVNSEGVTNLFADMSTNGGGGISAFLFERFWTIWSKNINILWQNCGPGVQSFVDAFA